MKLQDLISDVEVWVRNHPATTIVMIAFAVGLVIGLIV